MKASWRQPLSEQAYMTDASPTGGALISTTCSYEEAFSEMPYVTQGRWLLRRDWLDTVAQEWTEDFTGGVMEEAAVQAALQPRVLSAHHQGEPEVQAVLTPRALSTHHQGGRGCKRSSNRARSRQNIRKSRSGRCLVFSFGFVSSARVRVARGTWRSSCRNGLQEQAP